MITIEQVEFLKSKADISYDEAKKLLEKHNGDMVEALTELEKSGKINKKTYNKEKSLGSSFKRLFKKGHENRFVVRRGDDVIANLSINFMIFTLIFAGHFLLVSLIIILLLGYKINFKKEKSTECAYSSVKDFVKEAKQNVENTVNNLTQ